MCTKNIPTLTAIVLLLSPLYMLAQDSTILISPSNTQTLLQSDSNVVVLDVRTPAEFNSEIGHLAHAILLPVQELEQRVDELRNYQQELIIVYCRSGHRSTAAIEILRKHGYNVRNMEGGIARWIEQKLPVVKEKQ